MNELSETNYRISIREYEDMESESQRAWIVDLMDTNGNCIIEGAGVAGSILIKATISSFFEWGTLGNIY